MGGYVNGLGGWIDGRVGERKGGGKCLLSEDRKLVFPVMRRGRSLCMRGKMQHGT